MCLKPNVEDGLQNPSASRLCYLEICALNRNDPFHILLATVQMVSLIVDPSPIAALLFR